MSNTTEVLLQVCLVFYLLKILLEGSLIITGILFTGKEVKEREERKKRAMADLLLKEELVDFGLEVCAECKTKPVKPEFKNAFCCWEHEIAFIKKGAMYMRVKESDD